MGQKKHKRGRCTANSVPLSVKIARNRKTAERTVDALADAHQHDAAERVLYLAALVLHDEFGFGHSRLARFLLQVAEISKEYNKIGETDGWDYADEKVRRRIEELFQEKIPTLYSSERMEEAK